MTATTEPNGASTWPPPLYRAQDERFLKSLSLKWKPWQSDINRPSYIGTECYKQSQWELRMADNITYLYLQMNVTQSWEKHQAAKMRPFSRCSICLWQENSEQTLTAEHKTSHWINQKHLQDCQLSPFPSPLVIKLKLAGEICPAMMWKSNSCPQAVTLCLKSCSNGVIVSLWMG